MKGTNVAIIVIALAVLVSPVVFILWKSVKLSQPWKAIFCLSVLPLFLVGMGINYWVVDTYAPGIMEAVKKADEADRDSLRRRRPPYGLLVMIPIPLLASFVWFYLIRAADRATRSRD